MGDITTIGSDSRKRLRHIHRAASELRRGLPVVLIGAPSLIVLCAETAGSEVVKEVQDLTGSMPVMLLAAARAAAILRAPVQPNAELTAISLPQTVLESGGFRTLPDPTVSPETRSALYPVALPGGAAAAIRLAKVAQVLPAVLAWELQALAHAMPHHRELTAVTATDVLAYQDLEAAGMRLVATADVPLEGAPESRVAAFRSDGSEIEHLAIIIGEPTKAAAPLVRIHSECFTGDLLGSMRCDCGPQLREAIRRIAQDGAGVVLYLGQEGRGIGLVNKLRAYSLQDRGLDTMDANRALGWGADERTFKIAATMLRMLGLQRVRVLTNNPDKIAELVACGVDVVGREAHTVEPNGVNDDYLATKAARFGHMLD